MRHDYSPALRHERCDTLFHCAAYFREYYLAITEEADQINVHGTVEILDAALRAASRSRVREQLGVLNRAESSATIDSRLRML